jgi:hypothetical protein
VDVDFYSFTSPTLSTGTMALEQWAFTLHWKPHPRWTLLPKLEAYTYDRPPHTDAGADFALASRAIRLVRIGPRGSYSGAFGAINSVQQLLTRWEFDRIFSLDVALSRINVDAPDQVGASLWVGLNRRLGYERKWIITPVYEHFKFGPTSYELYSVHLTYEANEPYVP